MTIPAELRYTENHEWARLGDDGHVWVGITDFGQSALGDLVFVGDVTTGAVLDAGAVAGIVESVKAVSDVHAPVAGKVVAYNAALDDRPELLNEDPYANWIFKLETSATLDELLDAAGYAALVE